MGVLDHRHPLHPARMYSPDPLLVMFAGATETQCAARLGVEMGTVRAWRNGARVRVSTARRIAKNLGSTVADIWFAE